MALVLSLCAAPAQAANSCVQAGAIVTATFGGTPGPMAADTMTISEGLGDQKILVDGVPCAAGAATTANTDTIKVVGDLDYEQLTIDLVNGTFLGGPTDEVGTSDEVEFEVSLSTNFPTTVVPGADVLIKGTSGVDDITVGGFLPPQCSTDIVCAAANLNAGETTGIDADVVADYWLSTDIDAFEDNDILSSNGGDGIPTRTILSDIDAGAGNDDLTLFGNGTPGPGNDTVRFPVVGFGVVSYASAPSPVTITAKDGTVTTDWGGTDPGKDGHGGTDTYIFTAGRIDGTGFADTFNGGPFRDVFFGGGAGDAISGAAGDDGLAGGSGVDTVNGGADNDEVRGESGNDNVFGDTGNDTVDGGPGDDNENGGDGDDVFRQSGFNQPNPQLPNGADDMHGNAGTDLVQYGDTSTSSASVKRSGAVSVDFDGNFDDGAIGPPSEGDNVRPDVENANGGLGNDTLVGDGDPNVLRGWTGADNLTGGGANDTLEGLGATGPNAAAIEAALTDSGDTFNAVGGADTVNANEGDDTISSIDGFADTLNCGPGFDSGTNEALDILSECEFPALSTGGGGSTGTGSTGGTTTTTSTTPPPVDPPSADLATATRRAGCLTIPSVVRDQRKSAPGGGVAILQTRQVDDPARPLRLTVRLTGSPRIGSVVFKVNGRTVPAATTTARAAAGSTPARPVAQDLLKVGGGRGARNTVVATVTLVGGRRVVLTQFMVILKCSVPVTSCKRLPDPKTMRCTSATPAGGRRARVTVSRTSREVATGTATVTRGKYTVVVRSPVALAAGTYAYKHVVTTAKPRQRYLMIRRVNVS